MRAAWRLAPLILAAAAPVAAQETPPAEPAPPPEGSIIINLPSADLPKLGTLTLLISHRFSQPVSDSNYHTLFSFDSAANINIGMAYVPLQNLEVSLQRAPERCFCGLSGTSSSKAQRGLEVYELGGKYRFLSSGPFRLSLRLGGIGEPLKDWRTAPAFSRRRSSASRSDPAFGSPRSPLMSPGPPTRSNSKSPTPTRTSSTSQSRSRSA